MAFLTSATSSLRWREAGSEAESSISNPRSWLWGAWEHHFQRESWSLHPCPVSAFAVLPAGGGVGTECGHALCPEGNLGICVWAGLCVVRVVTCRDSCSWFCFLEPLYKKSPAWLCFCVSSAGMGVTLRNHSSRPGLRCFPWFGAGCLQMSYFMLYDTRK